MSERVSISVEIRISEGGIPIAESSIFQILPDLATANDRLYSLVGEVRRPMEECVERLLAAEAPPAPEVPAPDEA